MDIQVQELIDKIKRDGIKTAADEAARVKYEAESEARQIVETAKKEAAEIIARGKQDAERSEKAGVAALEQASRNLVLAFKGEIQALLDKLVHEEVGAAYKDELLKTLLPELLKNWAAKGDDDIALILSDEELGRLRDFFTEKLKTVLQKGIELKSDRNLTAGFRIASQDGAAYYDFSADSVAQMLSAYLSPRLAEILKASSKGI